MQRVAPNIAEQPRTDSSGLHCPVCDYNLTGSPTTRCSECGTPFDPIGLRAAKPRHPPAFEQARGVRRIVAFAQTWLTVLFAPWIFARQSSRGLRLAPAAAFGAICFASTLLGLQFGATPIFILTWVTTAAVCIVAQTILLTAIDIPHWRDGIRSIAHWFAVSCYTSAVMITETVQGPPLFTISFALELLGIHTEYSFGHVVLQFRDCVPCAQVLAWSVGLALCAGRRLFARSRYTVVRLLPVLPVGVTFLALYVCTVDLVGTYLLAEFQCSSRIGRFSSQLRYYPRQSYWLLGQPLYWQQLTPIRAPKKQTGSKR